MTLTEWTDLAKRAVRNRDYSWSVVSSYMALLLNIVVQILLVPLYLDHLGKAQFGILIVVLASINYLGFGVIWASSGVQRILGEMHVHKEIDNFQRTWGLCKAIYVLYAIAVSALALGVVWIWGGRFVDNDPQLLSDLTVMLFFGAAYMVFFYDLNVDRLVMNATGNQAHGNVFAIISQLGFALFVVPSLYAGWGLPGVMAANFFGVFVAWCGSGLWLRFRKMHAQRPNGSDKETLKRLIGPMGMGYMAYGVLLLTLLQADAVLLGVLGGATMVADFVLIWKVAEVGMQALWRLPESMVPYLIHMDAQNDKERLKSIYQSARKAMIFAAAVAGVVYALAGQFIVEIWVGEENAPDEPWGYVLAGGALFWMVSARLPAVYAYSLVRLKPLVKVVGLEVGLRLLVFVILFPIAGLLAPLLSVNVVHLMGVAYLYQRLYRSCNLD